MKEKRNGIISLWKFLFAIVIAFFHCSQFYQDIKNPFFPGGYIAVEFFFIVSGFYLAKKLIKEKYDTKNIVGETIKYIFKKILKLFPYILIAYIFSIIIRLYYNPNLKTNELINSIWNLFLLREFGLRSTIILPQLWYLTSMFISIFTLYPIVKKYKEKFIAFISPLIVLFGLGYLSYNWVGLDHAYQIWSGFTRTGIIRGFIELNLGMILYLIHLKLSKVEYTKIGKLALTFLGEGLLVSVLIVINYIDAPKYYDYIMLFFISIAVIIISSEKTLEYNILSGKFFYYLEKLSMPIFINHVFVINLIDYAPIFDPINPVNQSLLAVIISIIFSIIEMKLIDSLNKYNVTYHLKKVFIKC